MTKTKMTKKTKTKVKSKQSKATRDLVARQMKEPIYLTNGCCEATRDYCRLFEALGLRFGAFRSRGGEDVDCGVGQEPPRLVDLKKDGFEFYPLTRDESALIAEDSAAYEVPGYFGGEWRLSYTVLYQGTKWLAPTFEVQHNKGPFEQNKKDPSPEEALALAHRIAGTVRPNVERVGGQVRVERNDECFHEVVLLLPMAWAMERFGTYTHVEAWLRRLPKVKASKGGA